LTVRHHDLCFGCGQANLFGLQLEMEEADGGLAGRFFVKQDHQGPTGAAHDGIIATALEEAMALAGGVGRRLEVELRDAVPVGGFVDIEAHADRATARQDGRVVAEAWRT
jgi:acyl-coenzyme A thioesterase PaaI-like protein